MSEIDYEAPLAPRDYATARRIVASDYSDERRELEIMAALSSERAKARAPFLALADECEAIGNDRKAGIFKRSLNRAVGLRIRRAAQDLP